MNKRLNILIDVVVDGDLSLDQCAGLIAELKTSMESYIQALRKKVIVSAGVIDVYNEEVIKI